MVLLADVTAHLVIQDAIDAISLGQPVRAVRPRHRGDLRDHATGQLRPRRADHGGGLRARARSRFRSPVLIPLTLVDRGRARPRDGARRVPSRAERRSPATLLITSFALSFLLQNPAALTWGALPRTTTSRRASTARSRSARSRSRSSTSSSSASRSACSRSSGSSSGGRRWARRCAPRPRTSGWPACSGFGPTP